MPNEMETAQRELTEPAPEHAATHAPLIAPAWHTALIVILAATTSIAGARGAHHLAGTGGNAHGSNLPSYLASIAMEWVLAAVVFWGLRMRRTSRCALFMAKPSRRAFEWLADAGAALAFWFIALMVLSSLAFALKPLHLHPGKHSLDRIKALHPSPFRK